MTHAEARSLLALHALGILERPERAALRLHLAHCGLCRAELTDLEATAAGLARTVPPVQPSATTTARILAAVRRGDPPGVAPGGASAGSRRARVRHAFAWMGRVALVATVAGLVVSHWTLRARLDEAQGLIARGYGLLRFLASPDVRTVAFHSDRFPEARAFVSYEQGSGRFVVFAFGVPPAPSGQVYQLWAIDDAIRPAAVFAPDARGGTLLRHREPPRRSDTRLFAITLEPAPGTPEPTGTILFLAIPPRQAGGKPPVPLA